MSPSVKVDELSASKRKAITDLRRYESAIKVLDQCSQKYNEGKEHEPHDVTGGGRGGGGC